MSKQRIIRPGLSEFMQENYGKVKNADIAAQFYVEVGYIRNLAKRMKLTKPKHMSEVATKADGVPYGYKKEHLIGETKTGMLLKKDNVTRHVMR